MKRQFIKTLAVAIAYLGLNSAFAQQTGYPQKPVRLVIPFPAGGIVDTIGRELADRLAKQLDQSVVVENRVGAGGAVGTETVAKAAPDGLTLLLATSGHAILPAIRKLPFDPIADFTPVATIADVPQVITVPASLHVTSLQEFTALAKTGSRKLSFASSGNGSLLHLLGERYQRLAGVQLTHVPYKGQPQAMSDLIAGRVDMMPLSVGVAAPHIASGKLTGLAVTAAQRSGVLPRVPTTAEAGMPGLKGSAWFAVLVPAGTPGSIVRRLADEIKLICSMPEFAAKVGAAGGTVTYADSAATDESIRTEVDAWRRLIQDANIKVE